MLKYSICIVKNRTKETIKIKKYLDWFSKYTPLEIEVDVIETDFDVTPQFVGNQTYKGVICGDDIIPKLRTVIPEGKYNAVVLYVGNDLGGIRVSISNGDHQMFPLYADTELIQLRTISDNGKDLNHEMFHSFFQKSRKCQINLIDPLDTYIQNDNLAVSGIVDTNREMALKLLSPYWKEICAFRNLKEEPMKIITITRTKKSAKETIGELRSFDGKFGCDTLELAWKDNSRNISCIPTGNYKVKWTKTLKFPFGAYQLQDVKNRTGIFLHSGNYFFNVQGCILLGSLPKDINKDGEIDLQNSKLITDAFTKFMEKKDFILVIK